MTSLGELRGQSTSEQHCCIACCQQVVGKMPRRCVAMYCSQSTEKLYQWPKDSRARKWTSFIRTKRMNFTPSSTSVLCYLHFKADCFLNRSAYNQGFAKKLLLNATAVPTIHLPPRDQQVQYPPVQRATAAKRDRKRTVAEAIGSETAECGDLGEDACPERRAAEPPHIKEEEEDKAVPRFKEEARRYACVKREEEPERPCIKEEAVEGPDIKEEEEEDKAVPRFKEEARRHACVQREEEPERPCIKEEAVERPDIKEEEEEEEIFKLPLNGVPFKVKMKVEMSPAEEGHNLNT